MEIKEALEKFYSLRDKIENEVKEGLGKAIGEILKDSDKIEKIGWTQYTPWFNDGDTCYFSVNSDDLDINGVDHWEIEDDQNFFDEKYWSKGSMRKNPMYIEKEGRILEKIKELISSIPEEILQGAIGDHVQVTVDKEGNLKTEEYDHE